MGEEKRKPGRPRKWASDAERMRATRAAQRAAREAALPQEGKESCDADRRGEAPKKGGVFYKEPGIAGTDLTAIGEDDLARFRRTLVLNTTELARP